MVKNLPAMQETGVQPLGWEDPPEKEMATHSSILAWRILYLKSLVGYSPGGHKELDTAELNFFFLSILYFILCCLMVSRISEVIPGVLI